MPLCKRIIPKLDIKGDNLVKGINLEGLRVLGKPEIFAKNYYDNGADELFYQDVVASLYGRNTLDDQIKKTAKEIFIPLTVGGGIRNIDDIARILTLGADKISINSAAIKNPLLIKQASEYFGNQCIVVAVDAKKQNNDWYVYSHGGTKNTGLYALDWIEKVQELGAGEILLTSMDKDGTKSGFDIDLLKKVSKFLKIPVIASGGVGKLEHFYEGVTKGKANALLAASVFHFNEISIKEVKDYLLKKNIEVRL